MSLGPTVALVAAGLAVAGGASYVSLMHGDGSRAPGTERMVNDPRVGRSINQLSPYLDATFASLRSTTRAETEVTATASIGPAPTFAERFAGVMSGVVASSAPTRSIASPKVRAAVAKATPPAPKIRVAALRLDERPTPQPEPKPYQVASYAPTRDDTVVTEPFNFRSDIRVPPLPQAVTSLVPLDSAPFPIRGGSESASAGDSDKRVRIHFRSRISWEHGAYSDPRVLLHIPKGFDPNKPSVMVVFYHGHGATLTRDVLNRQEVPDQISEAGANAVLVAPQLAYDARSSNPGKLWEPGAFARMVREAGDQLTKLYGDPRVGRTFANMPIIIVAYSGGYLSAATSLERGGVKNRVRGVVLLDALYGELGGFASWISHNRSAFFVSSYTRSTRGRNAQLEEMLSDRDVTSGHALKTNRLAGNVVFLPGDDGIRHRDFVNHAWADKPIKDILTRLPEYRL
jgi:hypothetical protein